tara:strand:- start:24 stop:233 length:210 start_codon:yes stop_codon:yes gene_type:complete
MDMLLPQMLRVRLLTGCCLRDKLFFKKWIQVMEVYLKMEVDLHIYLKIQINDKKKKTKVPLEVQVAAQE